MTLHLVLDEGDATSFRCDDCGASSYFDVSLPAVNQMSAFSLGHPCGDDAAALPLGFGFGSVS